nr:lasso peptide biosynthesis B2 protein [Elstera litoralis]
MLRRRGLAVQVHFGVTKDADGKLLAHAWSRCQGELVTGGQQMPEYQPISVFVT